MSLGSSSSSEPPSNRKVKGNQYHPYIVYPPKEKIELSKYNGSEDQCVAWLNKGEEYFDIYNIKSDEEKVKYVSMHMEGYAYNWYLWWKRDNFTYTSLLHFDPKSDGRHVGFSTLFCRMYDTLIFS